VTVTVGPATDFFADEPETGPEPTIFFDLDEIEPWSPNGDCGLTDEPSIGDLTPAHSWQPVPLVGADLEPREPPAIAGIAYAGLRHAYSGEPESLKTLTALVQCVEQINVRRTVLWIDLEMGRRAVYELLQALGLTDEQIARHFIYLEPQEPLGPDCRADLEQLVADRNPSVVVIDSHTPATELHGLDPNSGRDIQTLQRELVEPLRAHGAAVIVIDHLAKAKDGRGRYSIGSERKLGVVDVHLGFEVVRPFGRGKTGAVKITVHKDRPGHLPRPKAADLELRSDPDTGRITWTWQHADHDQRDTPFRPTVLMERVSRYLEDLTEPASRNTVEKSVKGSATDAKRLAVQTLIDDGYVKAEPGLRGAQLLSSVRAYRQELEA
jgi:hypothetical protein